MFVHRRLAAVLTMLVLIPVLIPAQSSRKAGSAGENPFLEKARQRNTSGMVRKADFMKELSDAGNKVAGMVREGSSRTPGTVTIMDVSEVRRLGEINGGPVRIVMDEKNGTPIFIRGTNLLRVEQVISARITTQEKERRAQQFLNDNRQLLKVKDPANEFIRIESQIDDLGMTHVRFQQTFRGIEIWGRDIRVHLTRDGRVECLNGRIMRTPSFLEHQPIIVSEDRAAAIARAAVTGRTRSMDQRIVIDADENGGARICWLVNTRGALDENWMTFVDAETGVIRRSYNNICYDGPVAGSGTDLLGQSRALNVYQVGTSFYMIDASKPMFDAAQSSIPQDGKGVIYTLDAQNTDSSMFFVTSNSATSWSNASAVSAAANGSKVYDYFNTVHGRNSIDGKGTRIIMLVRFNVGYNNAFWDGTRMVFGAGDGSNFADLAAALDVTGHEMTHGVVMNTANLVYENQAGALNESFADAFGALAEFWVEGSNGNWMMGESITTPSIPGDALRRLDDPAATNIAFNGQQPAHMNQYQNLPNTAQGDHGGVHVNSGIPNKAFYLFATSAGVTLDEAGQVYYRALTTYLTRNSQFVDCRLAVIKSAEDLFGGPGNAKATAAAAAFDAVGIGGGNATPPPPTQTPVQGNNFLAVIDAGTGVLARTSTTGTNVLQMTTSALYSRPTVTDDGSLVFYVDGSTNLHVVRSDGSNDQVLTTSGGYNNVSISPDGRYLAATSTFDEANIYLFDFQNGGAGRAIPLYTPTYTEGVNAGTILYPDRIDWASDSQTLMYDGLNQFVTATGDTMRFWDINLLRVSDGVVGRLFPPQPPGVDIGNAVFASNTDNIIAFDYLQQGDSVRVLAVNLNTGSISQVTNNWFSLGSPSFSADDQQVYYHYIDQSAAAVYVVDLASDGMTGLGNDQVILNGGVYPVSFTVGTRTTDVSQTVTDLPGSFGLRQNYPNPFNPSTTIVYDLNRDGFVSISVFDLLGRKIVDLVQAVETAGTHTITFDAGSLPSGTYAVRLRSGGQQSMRRISLLR